MRTFHAILVAIVIGGIPTSSHGFTYLFGSKWDAGGGSASLHGFTAPNGPRTPGAATWSLMGAGIGIDLSAALIDPDHDVMFPSVPITDLGVPGFGLAHYEAMINSAINQWAAVSGFTNLGQVADGGGAAGSLLTGGVGDIRIGAWEITAPSVLAHNFAPGTAGSAGGNNIFGDMHIDVSRTWIDNPTDTGGDAANDFDLYTVILHEIGHALGLGHSTVPFSVMEEGYRGGRRVLHADDIAGIQALYGGHTPVHFSVGPAAEGIMPGKAPNAVHASGMATGGAGLVTTAVVFVSPTDGTNTVVTPPPGFGLVPADDIDGISNATSGSLGGTPVLLFSVDTAATGKLGTDLHYNAVVSLPAAPHAGATPANPGGGDPGNESAGDIYASSALPSGAFGYYPSPASPIVAHPGRNRLFLDEQTMGLQAPALNGSDLGAPEDNLDGIELDGSPSFFSLTSGSPTAMSPLLTVFDAGPVPVAYPLPLHMGGETRTGEDILYGPAAAIYAPGHTLGLVPGDDIDALVVSDVTFEQFPPPGMVVHAPNFFLNPGIDMALFSLAPGSPSLLAGGFSPGDVFFTSFGGSFTLYASAAMLGLLDSDNIDALDIRNGVNPPNIGDFVPEPATAMLLAIGCAVAGLSRRRLHRASKLAGISGS